MCLSPFFRLRSTTTRTHTTCVLPCHFTETEDPAVRIYSMKTSDKRSFLSPVVGIFPPPVDLRPDVHPSPASPLPLDPSSSAPYTPGPTQPNQALPLGGVANSPSIRHRPRLEGGASSNGLLACLAWKWGLTHSACTLPSCQFGGRHLAPLLVRRVARCIFLLRSGQAQRSPFILYTVGVKSFGIPRESGNDALSHAIQ